jgi:hypothetical protein
MRKIVCIASGPSVTAEDCEAVRRAGLFTIVTNSAYQIAPWANALYACDAKWLQVYRDKVPPGMLVFSHVDYSRVVKPRSPDVKNSGANAIGLAVSMGASDVILLGYDCKLTGGKTHFHGDHPPPLGNCKNLALWAPKFAMMAGHCKSVNVVNCSRDTALEAFPRGDLAQWIT